MGFVVRAEFGNQVNLGEWRRTTAGVATYSEAINVDRCWATNRAHLIAEIRLVRRLAIDRCAIACSNFGVNVQIEVFAARDRLPIVGLGMIAIMLTDSRAFFMERNVVEVRIGDLGGVVREK
jgi:hypothetical protein